MALTCCRNLQVTAKLEGWTDLHETFISGRNFKTGNRKLKTSEPEVEKDLIRKLVGFCNESPIFVFWFLNPGGR